MNINKAIELLQLTETGEVTGSIEDWKAAIKLGIEALRIVKNIRNQTPVNIKGPMKGETID